ncbi:MAG: hypothetical protein ACM3MH_03215 [Actinomycetota bacterium]
MRAMPIVLILFPIFALSPAFADDACRCQGCGCKGGTGWRGPDGACVPRTSLAQICGSPAGAPCKQENAPRVCFGKQAFSTPKAKTAAQTTTAVSLPAGQSG